MQVISKIQLLPVLKYLVVLCFVLLVLHLLKLQVNWLNWHGEVKRIKAKGLSTQKNKVFIGPSKSVWNPLREIRIGSVWTFISGVLFILHTTKCHKRLWGRAVQNSKWICRICYIVSLSLQYVHLKQGCVHLKIKLHCDSIQWGWRLGELIL